MTDQPARCPPQTPSQSSASIFFFPSCATFHLYLPCMLTFLSTKSVWTGRTSVHGARLLQLIATVALYRIPFDTHTRWLPAPTQAAKFTPVARSHQQSQSLPRYQWLPPPCACICHIDTPPQENNIQPQGRYARLRTHRHTRVYCTQCHFQRFYWEVFI